MVFSSILFLFRFMPFAFLTYFLCPKKLRNALLIMLSLIFYSWGEVRYFPIMIASIIVDYTASNFIEKNRDNKTKMKFALFISCVFNLGMLGFFKYTDFFIENINAVFGSTIPLLNLVLPLGISFYTFQTMSYTIDVYRGKTKAENNIINFGAFVVLFPQLIAGPIVRYTDISRELKERTVNLAQINEGVQMFIMGVASKVLIANNIGMLWTEIDGMQFANISTPLAWLAILAFAFQIYFDFSGYSLMAIGLGKMLGFDFPKNFDFPYISKSATEFWRRWHMTLGSWFREYLYFPLGGSRCTKLRNIFNLFVVWAATGFWHGAEWNFIFWGLFFFVILNLEKTFYIEKLEKSNFVSRIYMFIILLVSWAIFAITDINRLSVFITKMFSFDFARLDPFLYYLRNYAAVIIIAFIFSTPIFKGIYNKIRENNAVSLIFFGSLFLVSVAYLVDATYNPFLYFRF